MPVIPEIQPPHGVILPLDVLTDSPRTAAVSMDAPLKGAVARAYSPEKQRDLVRLIVASGLIFILGYVVVFATVEASSYPVHWSQTKEMLQIILPALTGVIGTVIGFYFGTTAVKQGQAGGDQQPPDA